MTLLAKPPISVTFSVIKAPSISPSLRPIIEVISWYLVSFQALPIDISIARKVGRTGFGRTVGFGALEVVGSR
jgi:hypothetical protein